VRKSSSEHGLKFLKQTSVFLIIVAGLSPLNATPSGDSVKNIELSLTQIRSRTDIVDVSHMPGIKLDLRYGTDNNFLKKNLYGPVQMCFLHQVAAAQLARAVEYLQKMHPGYKLILFDCLRPRSVQRILWAAVFGTPEQKFVGNPDKGSIHNYGFAVDLSVLDASGRELDMGTGFDFFGPLAEPRLEAGFLKSGELTRQQVDNRKILRAAMTTASFIQLEHEWWHYDALEGSDVRKSYKIVE